MSEQVSVGEQLVAKMVELLNAPADKPMPTVRQRPRPIAAEDAEADSAVNEFLLYAVKEDSQRESRQTVKRTRHVRLEIPVAGPPPLDQAADVLYLYVVKTLFSAAAEAALSIDNGRPKLFYLEEVGIIWETVSSYVDMSICVLELKFTFTTTTDPGVRV